MTSETEEITEPDVNVRKAIGFWRQLRRLLVFQFKLYIDAARDFSLSFLSFGAFILDVIQQNTEKESYFERVLKLGRRTEKAINLFEQHDPAEQEKHSVDAMIKNAEERIWNDRKE